MTLEETFNPTVAVAGAPEVLGAGRPARRDRQTGGRTILAALAILALLPVVIAIAAFSLVSELAQLFRNLAQTRHRAATWPGQVACPRRLR
jgi:hypothetical protein